MSYNGSKETKTYQLPANASWELDLCGKQTNIKRQKKAALEQSNLYRQAVQTQLIANIANSYYTLLMLDRQLEISYHTISLWEENVQTMRALKQAGLATEAAIVQAEANKYNVNATIVDLKRQISETENAICTMLG